MTKEKLTEAEAFKALEGLEDEVVGSIVKILMRRLREAKAARVREHAVQD